MGFLQVLQILSGLASLFHTLTPLAEQAFPNAKQGLAKADAVMSIANGALAASGATPADVQQLAAPAAATLNLVVAARNAANDWKPISAPVIAPPDSVATAQK